MSDKGIEEIIESMGGGVQRSPIKPEKPEAIHKRRDDIQRAQPDGRRNERTIRRVSDRLLREALNP